MTRRYVIDASVAAKLFLLDEPDAIKAKSLFAMARRRAVMFHAPAIFPHVEGIGIFIGGLFCLPAGLWLCRLSRRKMDGE